MRYLLCVFLLVLLCGCEQKKTDPLVITTNLWIGFTPVIYAIEKNMIDKNEIKIHTVSSLGESYKLYDSGLIDGFTGTQAEAERAKDKNLVPVVLFDISYGADSILSTLSESQLTENKNQNIDVYYEMDSINELMLNSLKKKEYIKHHKLNLINKGQDEIFNKDFRNTNTIIITYAPYSDKYIKSGMFELLNSKHDDILILDALYISRDKIPSHKKQINNFRKATLASLNVLRTDPKLFYETVQGYLKGQTYESFMESLKGIKWITEAKKDSREIIMMKTSNIDTSELLLD